MKSGGHGIWGGLANIQGGVSIDLVEFNKVDVDVGEQRTIARVGVGMKWADVYNYLGARGFAGRWRCCCPTKLRALFFDVLPN